MRTAGIIGLGLMGGSLARELAAAGWRVQGADRDPGAVEAARAEGVIDGGIRPESLDLLVLATPVSALPELVREVGPELPTGAVATDLGSTKRRVVEAAERAGVGDRFVGSHPMAGDHRSGWAASRRGLFRRAAVWIIPGTSARETVIERVEGLWRSVGGRPRRIDAAAHDRRVAWTSHLPQVAATALGGALDAAGIGRGDLGPGGRDATRLAESDPDLWTDVLSENADEVGPAVDALIARLRRLRRALRAGDDEALRSLLRAAADRSHHPGAPGDRPLHSTGFVESRRGPDPTQDAGAPRRRPEAEDGRKC